MVVRKMYNIKSVQTIYLKRILMTEHPADYWKVTSTAPDHWKQHYDQTDAGHLI